MSHPARTSRGAFNPNVIKDKNVFKSHAKVKTIQGKDVTIVSCNIRGWQSKAESLSNIARSEKADIILLQETHCYEGKAPQIKGYSTYFRNRGTKSKGGLATLVFDKLSHFVTKLETSNEPSEFFSIKMDCFDPPLVIVNFYGVIENQYTKQELLKVQAELFNTFETHMQSGSNVLLIGDFNNHLGNQMGLTQNVNTKVSPGGLNLANWVGDNNLHLLNIRDQGHTHVDASSKNGNSNILDLAIINDQSIVKSFTVDTQTKATPYRIRAVKGKKTRVFTDHRSLIIKISPNWSKKPKTNKVTNWNYSKQGGDDDYIRLTDEFAAMLTNEVEATQSPDELYNWFLGEINKIKMSAYGKTTSTITRAKKIEDDQMWHKRLEEVTKSITSLNKYKITDKIWEFRSKTSTKFSDKQFVSIKHPDTGSLTQNREETNEVILSYNYNLLRKGKVDKEEDLLDNENVKDIIIDCGMSAEEIEGDDDITWEEFQQVLLKVKLSGKKVYRDLIKGGPLFKYAYFGMMRKFYTTEELPKQFNCTTLMKLFKNKGSRNDLKSNRFIHLKDYSSKVFERLVMMKLERRMSLSTPDFQIGGQKQSSTTEHLLTLMVYMSQLEKKQGGGLCQFLDIKTCFDVIELRDILTETVRAGVTGKPLRNIAKFTDSNTITIQGDESGQSRTVNNSAGQGSGYAPVGTALTMATVIEDKIEQAGEKIGKSLIESVNGMKLSQLMFVDDLSKCCVNSTESARMGSAITEALRELKMQAHSEKSCILAFGRKREKFKEEVEANPTMVQGFKMGTKSLETYLGMQFSELGSSDSITKTLLARRVKCMTKAIDLRNKLEDIRVQSLGWLVTAITVFKATIVSTLTYGCGAWVGLTKAQSDLIEAIQRQCLTTVLGISDRCSYQSLLHVTNIPPATLIVKKSKVTFVNDLLHLKGKGICLEVIQMEHSITPTKGLIYEVKEICREWGLPDVTKAYADPRRLKRRIEGSIKKAVLIQSLSGKAAPLHRLRDRTQQQRAYYLMPKERAILAMAYEVGCLNFKMNRKKESQKKYGNLKCWVPACTGKDSLDHVMYTCQGYETPPYKDQGVIEEWIEYLYQLNKERVRKFRTSLVNWSS